MMGFFFSRMHVVIMRIRVSNTIICPKKSYLAENLYMKLNIVRKNSSHSTVKVDFTHSTDFTGLICGEKLAQPKEQSKFKWTQ